MGSHPVLAPPSLRLLSLALLCVAASARATVNAPGFVQTDYVTSSSGALGSLTGLAWAPDGSNRLFLLRKGGVVRVVKDGVLLPTPFANLAVGGTVFTDSECGLIGLAFDPNYAVNGFVYFFVTVSSSEQRIVRYTDVGDVGQGRTDIVTGLPTRGQNHDGGGLGFGPDGKLYWAIGDQGARVGVNADLTSLAAKVGRANPDGSVPADNPFHDGAGPNADFVWARGFRNPFTFTFNPVTDALWVNSVGDSWEQVFVVGRGAHAGYDAYEANQPAGFLRPVLKYRTNGTDSFAVTASRSGGTATYTTSGTSDHRLRPGERVRVTGLADATLDGDALVVAAVPSLTTFTVAQPGLPDVAASAGGTVETQALGGSITGGAFYDATQFPAAFRGHFFFGDFNSSELHRVAVEGDAVRDVAGGFASELEAPVDTAVGADGALYVASYSGNVVYRIASTVGGARLVVSQRHVRLAEGGRAGFAVSLAAQPAASVTVTVARTGGSTATSVHSGASLVFTPTDWSRPQAVLLAAADDGDAVHDVAQLSVTAPGYEGASVEARTTDDDVAGLVLSAPDLTLAEGASASFTVRLSGAPPQPVTVSVAVDAGGDADVSVTAGASLTFDADDYQTPRTVTVTAAHDTDATDDTATVRVTSSQGERTVGVRVLDDEVSAPRFTSTPPTTAVQGAPWRYAAQAVGTPAPTFSLPTRPTGMAVDATSGLVTWTPTATGTFQVVLRAANGQPPAADQAWSVRVAADAPPTVRLTRPLAGEVLDGEANEFFGDCEDDVGCVRGEFLVDGELRFTDPASGNHFHFGGEHRRFDVRALSDGPHRLSLRVVDTRGQAATVSVDVCVRQVGCGPSDAGVPDAGAADAGPADAGAPDAGPGTPDAGPVTPGVGPGTSACGCGASPAGALGLSGLVLLRLLALRRRRRGA